MPPTRSSSSHYIHSLTALRGIAALWVVLFHIDVSIYYRDLGALLPRISTGIFSHGYLWVDFFFLLSGFIIAHVYGARLQAADKPRAIKDYLWARFARVYPLHLFTLSLLMFFAPLAAYCFPAVVDGSWETYFAWDAVPLQLLFVNAMNQHSYLSWNIVSWSTGAEWWTYLAALGMVIALWNSRLRSAILVMVLAFVTLVALVYGLPEHKLDITFNYGFWRCLFEFVIGLGVYQCYMHAWGKRLLQRDWLFGVLSTGVIVVFHFQLADVLIIPLFILLILASSYNRSRVFATLNWPLLQYLGTISYSIYLLHGIWFLFFWFCWPAVKITYSLVHLPLLFKVIYASMFLSVTIISAHFSYRYIEVPGRRWFKPRASFAALSTKSNS